MCVPLNKQIDQRTKRLDKVIRQVEAIQRVFMKQSDRRFITVRDQILFDCASQNSITVVQRCIYAILLCSAKGISEKQLEILCSRNSLYVF